MQNRRHFLRNASLAAVACSAVPLRRIQAFTPQAATTSQLAGTIPLGDIHAGGELLSRLIRNYDRLEEDYYTPEHDFAAAGASEGWPGDKEGRIILALTLQAQATGREPKYLAEIIRQLALHVNEKGYLGPLMGDKIMEQQLSGHGWLLRGLSEYYLWKKDPVAKAHIDDIITNLALPTRGAYREYPIDPESRQKQVGGAAGNTDKTLGRWMVSTDIGCAFIFLDGVVQAYAISPSAPLKALIEEMIDRFSQIDLEAIQAQTHATLTALRGLLRFQRITGSASLVNEVEKRYRLYRSRAMTENYENFNWFGRPEWTESCAIVDSMMVAMELWQATGDAGYLEDAHHIYYNGICHVQRTNGGFGLDNCPPAAGSLLKVNADEAYWCCTMRGAEGLASRMCYGYVPASESLVVPFYGSSTAKVSFPEGEVVIGQESAYPFSGKVTFEILRSEASGEVPWKLFVASWMKNPRLTIHGRKVSSREKDGFLQCKVPLQQGTRLVFEFDQRLDFGHRVNHHYGDKTLRGITYGPLVLGTASSGDVSLPGSPLLERTGERAWRLKGTAQHFSPVYHLMDAGVTKESGYHKQILFKLG